ncbi:unnamed protein product [Didymodactylos carnosus]|uniref:MATH domain-containing protein n=1 Tax=Didymodactylos carnosus TaxID=1234261 RepID=A0A8S2CSY5_9BILA|nr:unnamed protein product [Didymodactylos carnosus]CAF3578590.1 unnamed protein product [Didymodactylos carnosus]
MSDYLSPLTVADNTGGYSVFDIQLHERKFICPECQKIIRDPVQLPCGDRCCKSCSRFITSEIVQNKNDVITKRLQKDDQCLTSNKTEKIGMQLLVQDTVQMIQNVSWKCRLCNEEWDTAPKLLDDRGFKREMDLLRVMCIEWSNNCRWLRPLKDYQKHLDDCHTSYSVLCDKKISSLSQLNQHKERQEICNYVNELTKTIADNESRVATIVSSQGILQEELSGIKEKVDSLKHASDDGTLVWRITDVSEKMADAQSERQTSIYSPPFYSSSAGYKMRARLYLHGDGDARRTHMSLFFVLIRGEFDSILKWPFNHKVTFCLFDQSGHNRHIIDSFCPDAKSNSFQQPRSLMNTACGIPKFCPLPMIQQVDDNYIRDNIMFIKVVVDFFNLPYVMLPYEPFLNPGLPSHVRNHMLKQQLYRYKQVENRSTYYQHSEMDTTGQEVADTRHVADATPNDTVNQRN